MITPDECQINVLEEIYEGKPVAIPVPLDRKIKLAITSRLDPKFKKKVYKLMMNFRRTFQKGPTDVAATQAFETSGLSRYHPGDQVRVISLLEIQATLDPFGSLKGCHFMPEMRPYCGTKQKVLKPVERFLDECSYSLKRCRGIILLDGIMCQGVAESGRCDRSCFYFWREEWLEKIDSNTQ